MVESRIYERVLVFSPKKKNFNSEGVECIVVNFDKPESFEHLIKGNDLFYCTASFIQKTIMDSQEESSSLKNVIPIAKTAARHKVNQFIFLSSHQADPDSLIGLHQLKGQMEELLKKMPFWGIHIFKPAILVGKSSSNRWGEQIAKWIGKGFDYLTGGLVSRYRPLEADVVAKVMVSAAQRLKPGIFVYSADDLQKYSDDYEADAQLLN